MTKKIIKKEISKKVEKKVYDLPVLHKTSKEIISEDKVRLVSFTLTAIIPIGQYENIQPSITVEGGNFEQARDYCVAYLKEMRDKYSVNIPRGNSGVCASKPEVKNTTTVAASQQKGPSRPMSADPLLNSKPLPPTQTAEQLKEYLENDTPAAYYMSEPFKKASQAIASCKSFEALDLIAAQVAKSTKLKDEEKTSLDIIIISRNAELHK